jgi:hypothetical protein
MDWKYKPFSEWAEKKKNDLCAGNAGGLYYELSVRSKEILDKAIESYITARFTPQEQNTLSYQLDLCKCGHQRREHAKIHSHNYTEGKCFAKDCDCGWFNFESNGK